MPGRTSSQVAVDRDHATLPSEPRRLDDVGRVGGADEEAEFRPERQRPDPLIDFALLDVELGVGEEVEAAHVIEMSVGDQNRRDIGRLDAAFRENFARPDASS